jgi:hypothetical protein
MFGAQPRLFAIRRAAGLLLASCGGGDPYAGLWLGTVSRQPALPPPWCSMTAPTTCLYSVPGAPNAIAGLIQGTGDFHGAQFTSADARDFSWDGRGTQAATVSAKISPRWAVSGTVNEKAGGADLHA